MFERALNCKRKGVFMADTIIEHNNPTVASDASGSLAIVLAVIGIAAVLLIIAFFSGAFRGQSSNNSSGSQPESQQQSVPSGQTGGSAEGGASGSIQY